MSRKSENQSPSKRPKHRALVLQGGGALGAYEAGVFKKLCSELPKIDKKNGEEGRPLFDVIAGTSIGAINAAILVSHFKQNNNSWQGSDEKLKNFWTQISSNADTDLYTRYWDDQHQAYAAAASSEAARRYYSAKYFQANGAPNVFSRPDVIFDEKFFDNSSISNNLWFRYSNEPLRKSLEDIDKKNSEQKFVNFPITTSPPEPRLLTVSVDTALGATVTFDSYSKKSEYWKRDQRSKEYRKYVIDYPEGIELSHVMASASIPVFYQYEEIDERSFWDGAVLSNTPLRELIHAHGDYWHHKGKEREVVPDLEVYVVNVWPSTEEKVPNDHDGVVDRHNDIRFSDRTEYDEKVAAIVSDYVEMVNRIKMLANNHIKNKQEQDKFNDDLKAFLGTQATSRKRNGEKRIFRNLLERTFQLAGEVIRIERRDSDDSISNKFADFTTNTINKLIKEGEDDAKTVLGQLYPS